MSHLGRESYHVTDTRAFKPTSPTHVVLDAGHLQATQLRPLVSHHLPHLIAYA